VEECGWLELISLRASVAACCATWHSGQCHVDMALMSSDNLIVLTGFRATL